MFSWSSTSRKGGTGGRTGYPAAGRQMPVAQTIQGTIRPPEFSRQQHLDSYQNDATLQRSTRKVSQDDTTYDTVFQTTSGEALILRVHLPAGRAAAPPQMTLVGCKATHAWLDTRMKVVGYNPLQSEASWKASRLLLGQAVHEVVKYLQLNPPIVMEMTDPGLAKLQQSMGGSNSRGGGSSSMPPTAATSSINQPPDYDSMLNSLTPPSPVDMPSVPNEFPELLDSKSREELQKLLNNELEFVSLVHQLPITQEMQMQRTLALEENTRRATSLLEREEEYTSLHGDVTDLKASFVTKLQQFDALKQTQDGLVKPPDMMQMKRELNRARKQAENSSEEYAMGWVESGDNAGAVDVQVFLKEFLRQRNDMHMRAAKLERLEQQRT